MKAPCFSRSKIHLLPFDIPSVSRKNVAPDFAIGSVSSDGVSVLLHTVERPLEPVEALAGCIWGWRRLQRLLNTPPAMLRFPIPAVSRSDLPPSAPNLIGQLMTATRLNLAEFASCDNKYRGTESFRHHRHSKLSRPNATNSHNLVCNGAKKLLQIVFQNFPSKRLSRRMKSFRMHSIEDRRILS